MTTDPLRERLTEALADLKRGNGYGGSQCGVCGGHSPASDGHSRNCKRAFPDRVRDLLAETEPAAEPDEAAQWGDVLQSPADVWEIGRNAGVIDALREHGPEDKSKWLWWAVMTPHTDENPYAEAGDRIALIDELDALLDDCDQLADTPEDPNLVKVWAVRQVSQRYGGKEHRWSRPSDQPLAPQGGDVEALAQIVADWLYPDATQRECDDFARTLLASDWLAKDRAEVARGVAKRIAAAIEDATTERADLHDARRAAALAHAARIARAATEAGARPGGSGASCSHLAWVHIGSDRYCAACGIDRDDLPCDHLYPPANNDGTCPSCGKTRDTPPGGPDA